VCLWPTLTRTHDMINLHTTTTQHSVSASVPTISILETQSISYRDYKGGLIYNMALVKTSKQSTCCGILSPRRRRQVLG